MQRFAQQDFIIDDGDERQTDKTTGGPVLAVVIVGLSVLAAVFTVATMTML